MSGPTFTTICTCGRSIHEQMPSRSEFADSDGIWIRCADCGLPNYAKRTNSVDVDNAVPTKGNF